VNVEHDFPQGNDLPVYVQTIFDDLRRRWPPHVAQAVKAAGCDVEDHQRGLRAWAHVGADTINIPTKGADPKVADYYPIQEHTRAALDEQIRRLVSALGRRPDGFFRA
jgi:hypothetical protein